MSEPQAAMLVVLRAGTSDVDATIIRSWLRMMPQIADVRPVPQDARQAVAETRVKSEVADDLTPIFENLRSEILGVLDAATGEVEIITAPDTETTDVTAKFAPTPFPRVAEG